MKTKNILLLSTICFATTGFAQLFSGTTGSVSPCYRTGAVGIGVTTVPTGVNLIVNTSSTVKAGKFVLGNVSLYGAYTASTSVAQIYNQHSALSRLSLVSASAATNNLSMTLDASLTGTTTGIAMVATTAANKKPFVFDMYGINSMIISTTGQVGIGTGTTSLGTMKLAVNGTIGAREVKVTLASPWPDYVFAPEYKLKTFEELSQFLATEKHLPYMPKASDVETEGTQSLGETQQNMLRSLEELYLYVLELKADNLELKKQIETLLNKK